MITIKAQIALLVAVAIAGFALITSEPAAGPQITTVKVKQVDARELIK